MSEMFENVGTIIDTRPNTSKYKSKQTDQSDYSDIIKCANCI